MLVTLPAREREFAVLQPKLTRSMSPQLLQAATTATSLSSQHARRIIFIWSCWDRQNFFTNMYYAHSVFSFETELSVAFSFLACLLRSLHNWRLNSKVFLNYVRNKSSFPNSWKRSSRHAFLFGKISQDCLREKTYFVSEKKKKSNKLLAKKNFWGTHERLPAARTSAVMRNIAKRATLPP